MIVTASIRFWQYSVINKLEMRPTIDENSNVTSKSRRWTSVVLYSQGYRCTAGQCDKCKLYTSLLDIFLPTTAQQAGAREYN